MSGQEFSPPPDDDNGTGPAGEIRASAAAVLAPRVQNLLPPRAALSPEPAPPRPPRRERSARHPVVSFLNGVITLLVLLVLITGGSIYYGATTFDAPGPLKTPVTLMIPPASNTQQIAEALATNGVIDDWLVFVAGTLLLRENKSMKAGEYEFKPAISMHEALDLIISGRGILHSLTLPEGLTSQQIIQRLHDTDLLTGRADTIPPEGSLLPETYKFSRHTPRAEIIAHMSEAMRETLATVWQNRAPGLPLTSPEQLLTLASMVEKETGLAGERPHVAAVFLNRLEKGMRLQSDPTIVYGISGGAGSLGRPLKKSDIDTLTPYNTYQIEGLPPGPICNPGKASLEAVAHPLASHDLYFVADGAGGHAFAATLDEHNRNVRHWHEISGNSVQSDVLPLTPGPADATLRIDADADPAASAGTDPLGIDDPEYRHPSPDEVALPQKRPDEK